eukprot:1043324-Pelagomonas_calceolata.AAC.3
MPRRPQAQQAKDDVMMEFNVDDTAADEREDMLAEMAFHVPQGHEGLAPENPEEVPAKVGCLCPWVRACACMCMHIFVLCARVYVCVPGRGSVGGLVVECGCLVKGRSEEVPGNVDGGGAHTDTGCVSMPFLALLAHTDTGSVKTVLAHTDTGGVSGDEAVARFTDVHVLAPRGRFDVDMFHGHVNLAGQAVDGWHILQCVYTCMCACFGKHAGPAKGVQNWYERQQASLCPTKTINTGDLIRLMQSHAFQRWPKVELLSCLVVVSFFLVCSSSVEGNS